MILHIKELEIPSYFRGKAALAIPLNFGFLCKRLHQLYALFPPTTPLVSYYDPSCAKNTQTSRSTR